MAISPKVIIPLTKARAKFSELCDEVRHTRSEKIITKNGESWAALVDADLLDHYHRTEREHIHITLLEEAIAGLQDLKSEKTLSLNWLKKRYGC